MIETELLLGILLLVMVLAIALAVQKIVTTLDSLVRGQRRQTELLERLVRDREETPERPPDRRYRDL